MCNGYAAYPFADVDIVYKFYMSNVNFNSLLSPILYLVTPYVQVLQNKAQSVHIYTNNVHPHIYTTCAWNEKHVILTNESMLI